MLTRLTIVFFIVNSAIKKNDCKLSYDFYQAKKKLK